MSQEVQPSIPFYDLVERSHQMVAAVRHRYGMSRLELGLLLDTVQENGLWAGKAGSFWEYCDDIKLNRSAVRQYMKVARKFLLELKLSEPIIHQLASCNMNVLERAASVLTPDNVDEVIPAVIALHQRDALAVLDDLAPPDQLKPQSDDVTRLFGRYLDLPDDRRIEFLHRVRPQAASRNPPSRP